MAYLLVFGIEQNGSHAGGQDFSEFVHYVVCCAFCIELQSFQQSGVLVFREIAQFLSRELKGLAHHILLRGLYLLVRFLLCEGVELFEPVLRVLCPRVDVFPVLVLLCSGVAVADAFAFL